MEQKKFDKKTVFEIEILFLLRPMLHNDEPNF